MTEDMELTALVRNAMEEDAGVARERLRAIEAFALGEARSRRSRRLFWRIGASALAAASLAMAVVLHVLALDDEADDCVGVEETIHVLCAVNGLDGAPFVGDTAGEILLAWQDAPCADLLSDMWYN